MTTATAHPNGATVDETSLRQCLACDKAFAAGTDHGKYCGRRCATLHGNQTAALARAADLVEDFEERLHRAIAQQLDQVLTLAISKAVDAVAPAIVQREVAAVVPAAVTEALATQAESQKAEHVPVCHKPAESAKPPPKSWTQQNEEVERATQAITRRLHDLPTGWQQLTVARGANGFAVKVLY